MPASSNYPLTENPQNHLKYFDSNIILHFIAHSEIYISVK